MRFIAIATAILLVQGVPAFAQTKPAAKAKSGPLAKPEPAKATKSCEEYGAGFVRMGETGTCMKIGGYVRIQGTAR
jgi:hypothetical protein